MATPKTPILDELKFDKDKQQDIEELIEGAKARLEICRMQNRLGLQKEDVDSQLLIALDSLGLSAVKLPGIGTVSYVKAHRETFSRDRLKNSMITHGVMPDKVNAILDDAAKQSDSAYIKFIPDGQ